MKKMLLSAISLVWAIVAANAQSPVLSEGFEGEDTPPAGWTVRSCSDAASNKYKWEQVAYGSDPLKYRSGYSQGGEKAMMVSSGKTTSTKPAPDSWLITPQLTVGDADYLSFMLAYAPVYNDNAVVPAESRIKFAVLVSTAGTDAADFTETLMEFAPYGETDWRKKVVSLEKFAGQSIYIAFREYGDCTLGAVTLNRTWIDDVVVGKDPGADLAACSLLSPASGPKSVQNVAFRFTNSGMSASRLSASYSVNGGEPVSEQLDESVTCASGDTLSYTFATPATLVAGENNVVKVWVTAGNDLVHENDTLSASVTVDNVFCLPYQMNSDNLSVGWNYTYHSGNLRRGTNVGWWQVPDETMTKNVWSYKLCAKESVLEGKWFSLEPGKVNVTFNYTSGTDVPLVLLLTDSETGETTETPCSLPAAVEAGDAKVAVKVPADGTYKLGIKCGAEYAGPFTVNSLDMVKAVPGDVAMAGVDLPAAMVADSVYSVRVKVSNYGEEKAVDVPVAVAVDGTVVLNGVIQSIEPGVTADWVMSADGEETGLKLAAGMHKVDVYTDLEDDADVANDTISLQIYSYAKPEIPFADSFENVEDTKRWTTENNSDNALCWNIGSAISNGVNWAKGEGENAAYMSSVAGAEHNAVLYSPVVAIREAGKVRLSYYYTTRMKSADADAETYLTAMIKGVSPKLAEYSVCRTDTLTDGNVGEYRQGYLLADIPAAGDYQVSFLNTGTGHDIVLDDIRLDNMADLAVVGASQTAASGYNNTLNTVSVKVANHGAVPLAGFTLKLTTKTSAETSSESIAGYTETVNPGDTVNFVFDPIDISGADTYVSTVEVVADGDTDSFNDRWTLHSVTSYANATLPYVADFDTDEQQGQWTFTGTWQTGKYTSASSAYNGTGAISHHKKADAAEGDWAFSGCIEIPAGTYDLSFFYRTFLNGKTPDLYAQNFGLYLGAEPAAEAMTQTLYESETDVLAFEKRYKKVDKKINVAEDGKYYLGVKCTSSSAYGVLYIDDIRIAENDGGAETLTSYDADFSEWYHYDPSAQFSQWAEEDGAITASQVIYSVGNPQTELPGILVSPAFNIEKDATVEATMKYSVVIDNAAGLSDEQKGSISVNLYVADSDSPDSFQRVLASGNDVSGGQNTAVGSFVNEASGIYYFGIGLTGSANCVADQSTVTYNIYGVNISSEVSGISTAYASDGSVDVFTLNGMNIGSFSNVDEAMKHCNGKGVFMIRQKSSPATMKIVR